MTDGHELRWGKGGGSGVQGRGELRGEKNGKTVIAQSIKYILKRQGYYDFELLFYFSIYASLKQVLMLSIFES